MEVLVASVWASVQYIWDGVCGYWELCLLLQLRTGSACNIQPEGLRPSQWRCIQYFQTLLSLCTLTEHWD